jgi:hypothetical protein
MGQSTISMAIFNSFLYVDPEGSIETHGLGDPAMNPKACGKASTVGSWNVLRFNMLSGSGNSMK